MLAKSRLAAIALVSLVLFAPLPVAAQSAYTVQGITPADNGNGTYPQQINDAGDAYGYSYIPSIGRYRPWVYNNGAYSLLNSFGGTDIWANDMNASGVVVGYSYLTNNSSYHAFLYDGTLRDLGTLNGSYSYAYAINSSGVVVGHSDGHAFRYSNGVMQRLIDLLPAGSGWSQLWEAHDINDAGQIIGRGIHSSLGVRGFLYTPANGVTLASIVAFGNSNTEPWWINASGKIAGREYPKAFVFDAGTYTVLPSFGGTYTFIEDLNDAGQAVGYSYLPGDTGYHAFIHANGQMTDLNSTLASTYSYARSINNSGVITGYLSGQSSSGAFVYSNGVVRRIADLITACNWSLQDAWALNNLGQIGGYAFESGVGYRGFIMTPAANQTLSTIVANDRSTTYRGSIQLTARLTSACSAISNETVTFSLNGTDVGSVQTGLDGFATLTTNTGNIVTGSYPDGILASFAGNAALGAASDTAKLTISRATPVITWNPAAIVEGTPLGAAQLNATADTSGTFSYSPSAGTVFGPGLRRLFTFFTPADTTNYNANSANAYLAVRAANPAVVYTARELSGLGGTFTEALAFNNTGSATGYSYVPGNSFYRAFLFTNGVTTELSLGGQYSQGHDINDAGQVVGWSYTTNNANQAAFLYSGGAMIDLGAIIRPNDYSEARAINNQGDVALRARNTQGNYHAFLYSNGAMTDLGALPNGYNESYPLDINASRQVVGYSYPNTNCYHAFLATTSGMQDLGTLGGACSQAIAINDAGHVIGWSQDGSNRQRAFVYKNGQMIDLGTLGGDHATANAINNQGVITGWSYIANNSQLHAFRYENGVMTDLGVTTLQSLGYDINGPGEIVGRMQSPTTFETTGFIRVATTLLDLNEMINVGEPAAVNEARFNNESGQILARNFANNTRWFVLTPTTLAASSLTLSAAPGIYRGTTTLTATLTNTSPSGANIQFRLNGSLVGTAQANAQGVAQLANVSLGTMNAGTYTAAASALFAGDATYLGATAAADVTIAKAVPVITWAQPAAITHPAALSSTQLNASANVSGQFSYSPSAGTVLQAGSGQTLQTTFTPTDTTNYEMATASVTINVLKRTPVVTWNNPAGIVYGTLLSGTQLNATASVPGQFVYTPASGTKLDAGNNQVLSVAFTPNDTTNYESVPAKTVTINVAKATPVLTWSNPADIVYGTLLGTTQLNAAADTSGTFSYSPAAGTKLNAGSSQTLSVTFTPDDTTNYNTASRTAVINVTRVTAQLTLGSLSHTFDNTPKSAQVTSDPAGLTGITVTYNGGSSAPTNAGSYTVVASLSNSNYDATPASGTLTIAKAHVTLTLGDLSQTFNGSARAASVTSDPAGVSGISITYDGSPTAPSGAGSYAVAASLDNANYEATPVAGTLTIGKASATITLANLSQVYNGSARTASASTNPTGLQSITLTYDGGSTAPVNAGSYAVRASLDNANYSAPDAQGTLVISKASATLTLGALSHTYDGSPKAATATSNPSGLTVVSLTYNGSATAPTNAGSYAVQASLVNQNHEAQAVNGTMTIAKANQSITFATLSDHTYGDAPFNVAASASSGLAVSFSAAGACSLSGSTVTITAGGQCTITASQPGDNNYNAASSVNRSFGTTYTWSDLLQPINTDGSSVFKLGGTIPVKFSLTGASAAITDLQARIYVAKVSNGVVGTEVEAVATNNADGGNTFRWDGAGQYIFNLGTKTLSQGTWQVRVDLLDGATHVTLISLRK